MPVLNVNTDAVVALTSKLEKMRKHDFPVTVRKSLNSVAFDNRNSVLPSQFQSNFIQRNKGTVRAFTRVSTAQGFSVNKMRSISGFIDSGRSFTDDMLKQELGGSVERSKIANTKARSGGSNSRLVSSKNRLRNIGRLSGRGVKKGNKKGFVKAAHSVGVGGFVKYGSTLFRINSLNKGRIKATPIYSDVSGRKIKLKSTGFVRKSGVISGQKMERFFISEAKKRILKK
ncbi:MAG: hypothetical protein S4CHLAM20_04270 [Chlamydiia bacterium]|nr:hypothetical protein [Chlamydiia bacterium]